MLYGPAAITQPQFSSLSSIHRNSESISSVLMASPLCSILQDRAIEALKELRFHIFYGNDGGLMTCGVPLIYRTRHDIAMYFMIINQADARTTNFCSSVLASPTGTSPRGIQDFNKMISSNQQHRKSKSTPVSLISQSNYDLIPTVFVCVGITGAAYIHASNPWLFSLPDRLHESTKVLTRLGKSLQQNSQEGKKWVRALLASLISDEDDLRTNVDVIHDSLSNIMSAANETRMISEKDQILSIFETNMVPVSDFIISLPSSEVRNKSGRSSRKSSQLSHPDIDLQLGFDPPPDDMIDDDYSSSVSPQAKQSNSNTVDLPSSFKTPRVTRWREQASKVRRGRVLPKCLSLDSMTTPDQETVSSSSTPISQKRQESTRHPPSPNHISVSNASSDTSPNTSNKIKGFSSEMFHASPTSPTVTITKEIDNISVKVKNIEVNDFDLFTSSNNLPSSSPARSSKQIVNIGLNEDLKCSYKASKLSSMSIEGIIQVQIKSSGEKGFPFLVHIRDHMNHVKTLMENKGYAELINTSGPNNENLTYSVTLPVREKFLSVFKYKCSHELRPVPIRVQTRVRLAGNICRVALQISSNPSNKTDLTNLNIFMAIPPNVKGDSVRTVPSGGVWNEYQRNVLWCVAMLGIGEKFQLQAQFEMISQKKEGTLGEDRTVPVFPVLVRCHGSSNQLSSIELRVDRGDSCPIPLVMRAARRCRIAHKEQLI